MAFIAVHDEARGLGLKTRAEAEYCEPLVLLGNSVTSVDEDSRLHHRPQ